MTLQNKGAVNADEERALIQGFVERWKLTYPIAISDKGEDFNDYGVSGIPTMVFIDKAGTSTTPRSARATSPPSPPRSGSSWPRNNRLRIKRLFVKFLLAW